MEICISARNRAERNTSFEVNAPLRWEPIPLKQSLAKRTLRRKRGRGGKLKLRALAVNTVNVTDPATGNSQKTEIRGVVKNPANVDYQRRGVITKGAILDTPLGQAIVTSRPGQHGAVNAVLVQGTQK